MADLVTVEQARSHLRLVGAAHDEWLVTWISAVSAAVLAWLKEGHRAYVHVLIDGVPVVEIGEDGEPVVNPIVQAAVLVELAQQFRYREGSDAPAVPSHWGHGFTLGIGATSLLSSLRKSTVV